MRRAMAIIHRTRSARIICCISALLKDCARMFKPNVMGASRAAVTSRISGTDAGAHTLYIHVRRLETALGLE